MSSSLLLDVGNTRLKYALLQYNQLGDVLAIEHDGNALLQCQSVLLSLSNELPVWVVHVLGQVFEQQLRAWCEQQGRALHVVTTQAEAYGVKIAYHHPQHYGVDRFVAIVAARHCYPQQACMVIDCGTAVTIDVIDGQGVHLGGAIFSGIQLCQQSLLQRSSGLSHVRLAELTTGELSSLASDTSTAIRNGCVQSIAGAIKQWHEIVNAHLNHSFICLLGGGDAMALAPFLSNDIVLREAIVLEGLAHIASHQNL